MANTNTSGQNTDTGSGSAQYSSATLPATAKSTHEMFVAIIILASIGMLLVILAGESSSAGNTIAAFLGIILLVQGITHVNPLVSFLNAHPLTPA